MLDYAFAHNEFYSNVIGTENKTLPMDIAQVPILTRKQLQENRFHMFSEGYKSKYFARQLHRQSSSGSSGIPINVYWDKREWYSSNLSLWRKRQQWYGIRPLEKCVIFTLSAFEVKADYEKLFYINKPSNILSINISLVHTEEQYHKLVKLINEFEPKWLSVQPFVLNRLIQIYKKYNINKPDSLIYIESVGEMISSDLKRRAIEFFGVPLANLYGSEEMNGIAYECPNNHMHILNDNVFVEVKNEHGIAQYGEGEALITNLNNYAMPLIRYNQGDQIVVELLKEECPYGAKDPIIASIKGRTIESIKTDGDTELNSFMLSEIIAEVNNQYDDIIIDFKYVYIVKKTTLQCYIEMKDDKILWYNNVMQSIQNIFECKMPNSIKLEVFRVDTQDNYKTTKSKILEIKEC